jgi:hypothetical protein
MRALFYIGDVRWTARARVFLRAARGLAARGHPTVIVCCGGTPIVERIAGNDVETVLVDASANPATRSFELRRVMRERFIEVAFVHTEGEQLLLSTAMRLAERGAVIRRVPAFAEAAIAGDRVARQLATAGLLFTSESEAVAMSGAGWTIQSAVAPLGVDPADADRVTAASRAELGLAPDAFLIGCPYDASGRALLGNVLRTLALLGSRHPHVHAIMVGPNANDDELRMHASAVGVHRFVSFLGDVRDAGAVLKMCDLVWLTAREDAGAYGLLDAMAHRRPIVAERSPLTEHYVADGVTGMLLGSPDPDVIASAVASVVGHPEWRSAMGNAARARVQRDFTETAMIDGFENAGVVAGDRTKWAVR